MKKVFLASILSLLLVFLPVPTDVSAEEWKELNTTGGQIGSGSYYLADDLTLTSNIYIYYPDVVTIDLSDYTLTGTTDARSVITLAGGTLTLMDSSTGKTGSLEGSKNGVYLTSSASGNYSSFTMNSGTIRNNTNSSNGGGVYVGAGCFTMNGGAITDNTVSYNGGGVYVHTNCSFTMNDGTISNNIATDYNGGGVHVNSGSFTMNGGSITDNTNIGVYVNGTFQVSGSPVISDNTAENVYLPSGKTITLGGQLSKASIGVTTATKPTSGSAVPITAAESNTSYYGSAVNCITSDSENYKVQVNSSKYLELAVNTYTVNWVDEDGTTVLKTDTDVEYGTMPSYGGETPTKEADAQHTYTFDGWTPEVSAVTGDIIYTATYRSTVNAYTVNWVDEDGEVLETDADVKYGTTPSYNGETPTKSADAQYTYTFAGWTPTVSEVTGDVTYTATYISTEKADPVELYYTITATAGEGGSITLTAADMTAGGYVVYEITPDDGYEIDAVTVDGTDVTDQVSDGRYTFENIQENHTISVTFKLADTETTNPETDQTEGDSTADTEEASKSSSNSGRAASSDSDSDDDSYSSVSSSDDSGTWVQDGQGWRYVYDDGSYEAGTVITDYDGASREQIVWKQIGGKWWAFGADGYLATGWVFDWGSSLWYYVDETSGMKTGWHYDTEDRRWYYLDTGNGHMLTGWQWIEGKWYYFNRDLASPTWVFDGDRNQWVYDESTSHRPFGSLYINEETPDGYIVGKDGSWEESEDKEQQAGKQNEEMEGGN